MNGVEIGGLVKWQKVFLELERYGYFLGNVIARVVNKKILVISDI